MEYVVIRPPVKSVTHPETILAHYVVTRTRIREVINAYYNSKFIVKDEYIDLRYFGKTGAPHPNAKIIAGMIKDKLEEHGYDFR